MTMTIEEMIALVRDGDTRTFPAEYDSQGTKEHPYLEVRASHKFSYERMMEPERPERRRAVTPEVYNWPRVSLDELVDEPVVFRGSENQLLDFYQFDRLHLLSDKLYELLKATDPDGFDSRQMRVDVVNGGAQVQFWAVVPSRVLRALDSASTKVVVKSMSAGKTFVKVLDFHGGCQFKPDVTRGAPTFIDFHVRRWMWSVSVFEQAQDLGCHGVRGIATCDWDANNRFDF